MNPGVPVFLLGESMGGAIVLRAGAEFGDEVNGIISSVPSAERYHNKSMAAKVAVKFMRNPNKPFDITSRVEEQATNNDEWRKLWKGDPRAKQELSPVELLKFDLFMRGTKKKCESINSPVILVQGLKDRLVIPDGTYEIFKNIHSTDKVLILVGAAEHLIFETPEQPKLLLDGLTAWIDSHSQTKNRSSSLPAVPSEEK